MSKPCEFDGHQSGISHVNQAVTCEVSRKLSQDIGLTFSLFFTIAMFVFAPKFAIAQTPPACKPNTANYPCVYVANGGSDSVSVINSSTNKVIGQIRLGKLPAGVALTSDNAFAYVAVSGSSNVAVIDTATGGVIGTVSNLTHGFPTEVAITPDSKFAYVVEKDDTGFAIDRIDTAANKVVDSVVGINQPTAIAITPTGTTAYVADLCPDVSGADIACVKAVDTSASPPAVTGTFFSVPNLTETGSIAVSADGETVCISVQNPNLLVGIACGKAGAETELDLGNFLGLTAYGLGMLPNGLLYLAQPGEPAIAALPNSVSVIDFTANPPTSQGITVGQGPTGVAIGPGALSVYVTNADNTVSVIDTVTNAVATLGSGNGFGAPQGVAAMSANPPVITTQPASQIIPSGQSVTLTVAITSAAPAFYQWYQGAAGDTSTPIEGALASSFTTPALASTTDYWVRVTNVAGVTDSNTATITVTTNQPPSCTLVVVGNGSSTFTDPLTVLATATCLDPQGEQLTTTISFGDGSPDSSGLNNGVFTATHTYDNYQGEATFPIAVIATNSSQLQSEPAQYSWTLVGTELAPPVFAGQSSTVTVSLASPSGQSEQVTFLCTTVTTSSGSVVPASDVGISCSSNPNEVTLTATAQPVSIVIQTTGKATAAALNTTGGPWTYAFWVPLPVLGLLGISFRSLRPQRRSFSMGFVVCGLLMLTLFTVSCGGGFTAPQVSLVTPAGNYQVTVVDVPVGSTSNSGFIQTSLIVPLTVSPFQ